MTFLQICSCVLPMVCTLNSLPCSAQRAIGEDNATYTLINVPEGIGTFAMSLNDSMVVTGYYLVSYTSARSFVQDAVGNLTTFSVGDSFWTEAQSINAAGQITGFFETVPGLPQGFVRDPDGHMVTFDLPASPPNFPQALPVSINDYGEIAGNYPSSATSSNGFTRGAGGKLTPLTSAPGAESPTVVTELNADGTIVGYVGPGGSYAHGFYAHPNGFSAEFDAPVAAPKGYRLISEGTAAESINAEGAIAGFYSAQYQCTTPCRGTSRYVKTGGFVRSPQADFTLFTAPGPIVTSPKLVFPEAEVQSGAIPGGLIINQQGTITGSYIGEYSIQYGFVRDRYGVTTSFEANQDGIQTAPTSINSAGVIVGSILLPWDSANNRSVGFVRIPQM